MEILLENVTWCFKMLEGFGKSELFFFLVNGGNVFF